MTSSSLPAHASVAVIGGGVMGCSTVYHLARAGITDAILIERNKLTSGTTWHSAAQVRALRSTRNLTDLIRYSIELYSQLEERTGQATGWINKGSVSIATHPQRLTHIRRQAALANLFGVRAEAISPAEALERWPLMNVDDVIGAVWSPDDGRVSPSDLCAALARGARAHGATLHEDTAVTGIVTQNARVHAVHTTAGTVRCDAVAVCAGLWSRRVAALAGVGVPVWPCEHFYLLTRPIDGISGNLPTLSDHDGHLYIRDDSGGLLVGCFEPLGKAIDPDRLGEDFAFQLLPEDWEHFEPMMTSALHRLPALETAQVRMLLNGPESFTPDGSFLLGEAAETRGLFLGCGMNSVGVATGGGAGMALAHCIVHGHTPLDLHEADPKRFPAVFNNAQALASRVPEVLGKHYEITYPGRQWNTARMLDRSPLHERWTEARAHFGQVYGYERPMFFSSDEPPALTFDRPSWFEQVAAEVAQAHTRAAVFDQSTFGKLEVHGAGAATFLNRVCANQMDRPNGRVIYTTALNARGGIESDFTAIRLAPEHYRLYVGTTARARDMAWLRRHLGDEAVTLSDTTRELAVLGLMGPAAGAIMERLGGAAALEMGYFTSAEMVLAGIPVLAARLSYVGESGWELTCSADEAVSLYDQLHGAGARPAGTLAQTSMRIEKGYLSYGHDIDTGTTPLQAHLDFAIDWNKDFLGREALQTVRAAAPTPCLTTLILDDHSAVPLGNEPVYRDGTIIGKTTSAAYGYRVGAPVALAFIEPVAQATSVELDIGGLRFSASTRPGAVFDPSGQRMRGTGT